MVFGLLQLLPMAQQPPVSPATGKRAPLPISKMIMSPLIAGDVM